MDKFEKSFQKALAATRKSKVSHGMQKRQTALEKYVNSMIGRRVKSHWAGVTGTVERWEPLSAGMTDIRVQEDKGGFVYISSNDVVPIDDKGPLPSRQDARKKAERSTRSSIKKIAQLWYRP